MEQCYFKALKTSFVENKGQSGPLSADSKTQGKCRLSVKFSTICQLSVKILAICQLSVNPIQTLFLDKSGRGRNLCRHPRQFILSMLQIQIFLQRQSNLYRSIHCVCPKMQILAPTYRFVFTLPYLYFLWIGSSIGIIHLWNLSMPCSSIDKFKKNLELRWNLRCFSKTKK